MSNGLFKLTAGIWHSLANDDESAAQKATTVLDGYDCLELLNEKGPPRGSHEGSKRSVRIDHREYSL
mgnify:CR=1 FL=1